MLIAYAEVEKSADIRVPAQRLVTLTDAALLRLVNRWF